MAPTANHPATESDLEHVGSPISSAAHDLPLHSLRGKSTPRAVTPLEAHVLSMKLETHMHRACEKYNDYAQLLGSRPTSDVPFAQAETVQQTAREIRRIFEEAQEAIRKNSLQLENEIDRFVVDVAVHADPQWYRQVDDLIAMEPDKFSDVIVQMHFPDIEDFCAYLQDILPVAARQRITTPQETPRSFITKLHTLLERVTKDENRPVVLSFLIFVKTELLLNDLPRIPGRFLREEHAMIDDKIFFLLGQHSDSDASSEYWNFAERWRTLVTAWEHLPVEPEDIMRLLSPLREKAELEIRIRTHLAINRRLPAELADSISEYAMAAEEIPLEAQ